MPWIDVLPALALVVLVAGFVALLVSSVIHNGRESRRAYQQRNQNLGRFLGFLEIVRRARR